MVLVDFHTHILPGIDDGSQDESMTNDMLLEEKRQGVVEIIATPHFYANQMSVDGFLENRSAALEKTERIRREADEPLPEIIPGAEVYYFSGIGRAAEIPKLCIRDTEVLLLEMPFEQWTGDVLRDVEDLIRRQKLTIVLAHIERYYRFQKDVDVWDRILELPLHTQINAGSFVNKGRFLRPDRRWQFCIEFLKEHPDTLHMGSDCHNMTYRPPNLEKGREAIKARLGQEPLDRIDASTAKLLGL
jgi:protein-tyrosine phosphatase